MTKNEFISKHADWKRYRAKIGYIYVAGFGIFILWSFLLSGMKDLHGASPIFRVSIIIYLSGGAFILIWLNKRRVKELGVVCPKCKNLLLFNAVSTRHIIMTGKCRRCGEKVIDEIDVDIKA